MTNIWVISDTHFGHKNILTFRDDNGELIRGKHFADIEAHDEFMIAKWNSVVRPQDHVYHLGDFSISRASLASVGPRLLGHKRLVRGNHDIYKTKEYLDAGFKEIYGVRVFPKHNIILSHIPLHPGSLRSRQWRNIHGHLHGNVVRKDDGTPDPMYQCVSVEHTNYAPVLIME